MHIKRAVLPDLAILLPSLLPRKEIDAIGCEHVLGKDTCADTSDRGFNEAT